MDEKTTASNDHAGPSRMTLVESDEEATIGSILAAKRAQRHARAARGSRQKHSDPDGHSDSDSESDMGYDEKLAHSPISSQGEDISLLGRPKRPHRITSYWCFRLSTLVPRSDKRGQARRKTILIVLATVVLVFSAGSLSFLFGRYAQRPRPGKTAAAVAVAKVSSSFSSGHVSTTASPSPLPLPTGPTPQHSHTPATDPIPFALPPPQDRRRVERLEVYSPITSDTEALEEWIAHGRLLSRVQWPRDHPGRKHDVVIATVNGSDWEHARQVGLYYAAKGKGTIQEWWERGSGLTLRRRGVPSLAKFFTNPDASIHRFREIDELRYAVRSAVQNLKDLSTVHVLTPSFSPPRPYDEPMLVDSPAAPDTWEAPRHKHTSFLAEDGRVQWGQVPQWLNEKQRELRVTGQPTFADDKATGSQTPRMRIHHDWSIWTPNWLFNASTASSSDAGWTLTRLAAWRREVLPTFNSVAMESNLGHEGMLDLGETFIYGNDDMFYGSPSTVYDFATPLYGPVLRLDNSLQVRGKKFPTSSDTGEWTTLGRSAWLLDERFGKRSRPYTVHEPKTFNTKLLREMRMMWADQFRITTEDRFRSEEVDRPGANTHFLMAHYLVERHREALLWSFIVAKMDENGDGRIDGVEMYNHLFEPLGIQVTNANVTYPLNHLNPLDHHLTAEVRFPYRSSMADQAYLSNLRSKSFSTDGQSTYDFVSSDGYPFMTLHPFMQQKAPARPMGGGRTSGISQVANEPWPRYYPREGKTKKTDGRWSMSQSACRIQLGSCLAGLNYINGSVNSDELFKRIAFDKAQTCGDCLIVHLLGQSGEAGFDAFLPKLTQHFPAKSHSSSAQSQEPHLPLTNTWSPFNPEARQKISPYPMDRADFSLSHLAEIKWASGTSLRPFAMQLIQRYTYTLSSAPIVFERMMWFSSIKNFFKNVQAKDYLFLCLNDDYGDKDAPSIRDAFAQWAKSTWSQKSPWEV